MYRLRLHLKIPWDSQLRLHSPGFWSYRILCCAARNITVKCWEMQSSYTNFSYVFYTIYGYLLVLHLYSLKTKIDCVQSRSYYEDRNLPLHKFGKNLCIRHVEKGFRWKLWSVTTCYFMMTTLCETNNIYCEIGVKWRSYSTNFLFKVV
jgi:hypothetical protein